MNFSLTGVGEWLLRASWQAGVLAILILVIQWIAGSRLSARWRYNLWMLVVLRLVLPAVPATHWSVHNWIALPHKTVPALPNRVEKAVDAKFEGVVLQSEPILVPTAAPRVISVEPQKSWKDYAIPAARILWLSGFVFFLLRTFIATAKLMMQSRRFSAVTDPQ